MIMTTKNAEKTDWTIKEVAVLLLRTEGRLRQLCIEHSIGRKITDNLRLLSDSDVKQLRELIRYGKNSEQST